MCVCVSHTLRAAIAWFLAQRGERRKNSLVSLDAGSQSLGKMCREWCYSIVASSQVQSHGLENSFILQ